MARSVISRPEWIKSSLSYANGNCVEVNTETSPGEVLVRNSRHPEGAILKFTAAEWDAFLGGAKKGEFDRGGHSPHPEADRRLVEP